MRIFSIDNTATGIGVTELVIFDLNGRVLEKYSLDKIQESIVSVKIDISKYLQGHYFARINQSDRSKTLPFVKL